MVQQTIFVGLENLAGCQKFSHRSHFLHLFSIFFIAFCLLYDDILVCFRNTTQLVKLFIPNFQATNNCLPSLLTTYLPRNPVAPKTAATTPLNEERPPVPLGTSASWYELACLLLCDWVTSDARGLSVEPTEQRIRKQKLFFHVIEVFWSSCSNISICL